MNMKFIQILNLAATWGLLLLVSENSAGQLLSRDTLAMVGNDPVTARQFITRYELMPWHGKENLALVDSTKADFVRSLIAEKLLSFEATSLGIGEDSSSKEYTHQLESMLVRDELYLTQGSA
jgi:hypothetical protein